MIDQIITRMIKEMEGNDDRGQRSWAGENDRTKINMRDEQQTREHSGGNQAAKRAEKGKDGNLASRIPGAEVRALEDFRDWLQCFFVLLGGGIGELEYRVVQH